MSNREWTILSVALAAIGILVGVIALSGDGDTTTQITEIEDSSQTTAENQSSIEDSSQTTAESQSSANVVVNVQTEKQEQQREGNDSSQTAAEPATSEQGGQTGTEERTESAGSTSASQPTADSADTTSQPNAARDSVADGISDGERICLSPDCPEQYVVKVADGIRFKRLLLSYDIVTFYGQFNDRSPIKVEHAVLDAFETSCFVWHSGTGGLAYYFFDARPGTDDGDKRRINATNADIVAAGIDAAAFQVNDSELDYFNPAGSITLPEALSRPCAG